MKRISTLVVVALLLTLGLTACGGNSAASDPVATVKDMMQVVSNKQIDKIVDYACASQKDSVKKQFDFASALGGAGMDPQKVLDALNISFENPEYTKVSEAADKATVHMKAKLVMKIDKQKFTSLVTEIMKAQGQELPADQIGPLIDQMATQFEQGQTIDNDIQLVKENGKWLVCQ